MCGVCEMASVGSGVGDYQEFSFEVVNKMPVRGASGDAT